MLHRCAWPLRGAAVIAAALSLPLAADELRNWFDDPFFQVTHDVPGCPLPAGPFVTEAERRVQAHRRAEKGTTCWLARECDRPKAYDYDADIAAALRATIDAQPFIAGTSLWVTVQGRVVYVEGCIARESQQAEIEAWARSAPHVSQAMAIVRIGADARVPYRRRAAGAP